jgi:predicted acylesterase/phospholipase RssA
MVLRINLAVQGGGAHGAFTWGVLDRLLEADVLDIRAVTASSAGAMTGAAVVSGLAQGGPDGARKAQALVIAEHRRFERIPSEDEPRRCRIKVCTAFGVG